MFGAMSILGSSEERGDRRRLAELMARRATLQACRTLSAILGGRAGWEPS